MKFRDEERLPCPYTYVWNCAQRKKISFYKSVFAIFCQFEANLNKIDGLQSMKEEKNNKTHIIVTKKKIGVFKWKSVNSIKYQTILIG